MRRSNRRRDQRIQLQCHQMSTCHMQDPAGKSPGVVGRIVNVSRGGAAIYLEPCSTTALALAQELLVTSSLPNGTRMKRGARVITVRKDESGGTHVGLRWAVPDPSDGYALMQAARFEEALKALEADSGSARVRTSADFFARLAKPERV